MSLRRLISLIVLCLAFAATSTSAETYVLIVSDKAEGLVYDVEQIIRLEEGVSFPKVLMLKFTRANRNTPHLSLVAVNDEYDDTRAELYKKIQFGMSLAVEEIEASITFDVLTLSESFSRSPSELRFPTAIVATDVAGVNWTSLHDPKRTTPATADREEDVDGFVAVEREPDFDYQRTGALVNYPHNARVQDIEGRVLVAALVGTDGVVEKTVVIESSDLTLQASATRTVLLTQFTPAIQNGKPIRTWVRIPILFKLQ